ncbi:hypothetical protein GUJ93_ZPchr0003g16447 [Zizania palustris]|uniref:Uncharacterized protein n=1 Tax=Zizania palustris TaxID=103762 RepID=A0A8J5SEI7_ZIZPA|nr:hypothetical protein GUJ93_ZPchr0003g16447 [Zizania palustris]
MSTRPRRPSFSASSTREQNPRIGGRVLPIFRRRAALSDISIRSAAARDLRPSPSACRLAVEEQQQQWLRKVGRPTLRRSRCLGWRRRRWSIGSIFSIGLHMLVLTSVLKKGIKKRSSIWVRTVALIDVFRSTGR